MTRQAQDPPGDGDVIVYEADDQWHTKRIREMRVMLGMLEKRAERIPDAQARDAARAGCRAALDALQNIDCAFGAKE